MPDVRWATRFQRLPRLLTPDGHVNGGRRIDGPGSPSRTGVSRGRIPLRYDVFVSYAHADRGVAVSIVRALQRRGLRVWFDETLIETFDGITRSIEHGLAASKALVAIYSPLYGTRRACQWELTTAFLAAQRNGEDPRRRVLVVSPAPAQGGAPAIAHIEPVELRDASVAVAPGPSDYRALRRLAEIIAGHVAALEGAIGQLTARSAPLWHGKRPLGAMRFVGRIADMWHLHSALQAGEVSIITGARGAALAQVTGMGGIGKSLLAEEYAIRFGAAYPGGVFWVRAHGHDDSRPILSDDALLAERDEQIRRFAVELGCDVEGLGPEEVRAVVVHELEEQREPYLWIVDDVADGLQRAQLDEWLAGGRIGKTLITTRSRAYSAVGTQIELGSLTEEEGLDLLRSHRTLDGPGDEYAAQAIVAELGGHALALDVAGAALGVERGVRSVQEYLGDIVNPVRDDLELAADLAAELPNGHEPSIAKTLARSLERLEAASMDLLRLAAVLAVEPIPPSLVTDVFARIDGVDRRTARRRALRAIRQLETRSLVDLAEDGAPQVHAIVSRTIRFRDGRTARRTSLRRACVDVISAELVDANARRDIVNRHSLVHARHLAAGGRGEHEARLMNAIGMQTYLMGDYRPAMSTLELATALLRQLLGDDHLETLAAENNLIALRQQMGHVNEAALGHSAVLKTVRRRLGDEHPQTLSAMSRMAGALVGQGDISGARRLDEFVLAARTRALGPDHAETLTAMDDLAGVVAEDYDKERAGDLLEHVVSARRRVLGPDHPDTLASIIRLGIAQRRTDDIDGARRALEPAAAQLRRVLGDEHPTTLRALRELAKTVMAAGDLSGARALQVEVAHARERVLGYQHRDTLAALNDLAETLEAQRDFAGALAVYERVLRAPAPPRPLLWKPVDVPQESAKAAVARLRGESEPV